MSAGDPGGAERHQIDGLSWWVPADADAADMAGGPRLRRLPFDEILSTRELAVGRTMLDIGANIGTMSITRAVLGDFDHVYAAEPDPLNYHCLVRNILDNGVRGRVLADRVAIGDREGEMFLQRGHSLTHHLLPGPPRDLRPSVAVPCLTLDAWLEKLGLAPGDIDFVKTDTQGWDARVLAGARGLLEQRHIAWEVEFSPSMLRRARSGVGDLYELALAHFTHFIDLRAGDGRRVRQTADMPADLKYVQEHRARYTNLLLFNADSQRRNTPERFPRQR